MLKEIGQLVMIIAMLCSVVAMVIAFCLLFVSPINWPLVIWLASCLPFHGLAWLLIVDRFRHGRQDSYGFFCLLTPMIYLAIGYGVDQLFGMSLPF